MTLKIQIKNSTTTAVVPSSAVLQAELAYSFVTGDSAGGDRLYIGNAAGGVDTIGGKYYTDMMDQPKGSVVPSSTIITDANNKIDQLKVDDLTLDDLTTPWRWRQPARPSLVLPAPHTRRRVSRHCVAGVHLGALDVDAGHPCAGLPRRRPRLDRSTNCLLFY